MDIFDVTDAVSVKPSDLNSVLNSITDMKAESLPTAILGDIEDDLMSSLGGNSAFAMDCGFLQQPEQDVFDLPSIDTDDSVLPVYGPFAEFESSSTYDADVLDVNAVPGVCGLRNLGNTCFMNAGLQCLLNNKTFRDFFGGRDLNSFGEGSLNMKFAEVVQKVWSGQYSSLHLGDFKECFGNMFAQFRNFRQHDCQEFLALLLDTMHEELNHSNISKLKNKEEVSFSGINNSKEFTSSGVSKTEMETDCKKKVKLCNQEVSESCNVPEMAKSIAMGGAGDDGQQISNNSSLAKSGPMKIDGVVETNATIYERNTEKMADLLINNAKIDKILNKNELDAPTIENQCNATSKTKIMPKSPIHSKNENLVEKNEIAFKLNSAQKIPSIEDFVKDTKILNTNVLVSDETNNLFKFDSEKFPKHDSNRLQETVDNLGHIVDLGTKQGGIKRVKITNIIHEKHKAMEHSPDPFCSTLSKRLKVDNVDANMEETEEIDSESSSQSSELFALNAECRELFVAGEIRRAYADWDNYKSLNQSVIVDTFHGQFRSSVVCSQCSHNSITYEPFMYLPVFLPHTMERQIVITFVQNDSTSPVRYLVNVNKYDRINKIREALQKLLDVTPEEIVLAEVFENHISRYLDENQSIRRVNDSTRSIYAFEVGKFHEENIDPSKAVPADFSEEMTPSVEKSFLKIEEALPDLSEELVGQFHICAICLEELSDSKLLIHPNCDCILCHTCIDVSCKHYGGSTFICPVCGSHVSPEEDFVPLHKIGDYSIKISTIPIPLVIRHDTYESSILKEKSLIGHPGLLKLPSTLPALSLYNHVDAAIPLLSTYTLLLVNSQGTSCSRCAYTKHCSGCEISRVGDVKLLPGESIAVCYSSLPLEIQASAMLTHEHTSMQETRHKTTLHITDCLEYFSERESLDEDSPWFCPVCRRNQQATKSLSIWKFPDVLIIYLKRFVFHDCVSIKVEDKVCYPLEGLDLSSFSSRPLHSPSDLVYDLQSCVCHFGGVSAGHYTSYSKHSVTNEWYYYNDETVKKEAPNTEDCINEYIFFYQKR